MTPPMGQDTFVYMYVPWQIQKRGVLELLTGSGLERAGFVIILFILSLCLIPHYFMNKKLKKKKVEGQDNAND